jgi:enediyne biosynthesis protein E4
VAYDENGKAMSGMGVTVADYDGDGRLDIFRSNFSDERETLYRNRDKGEFDEVTAAAGLAHNTRYVGWGCGFFDFDNDGWKDLLLVNGHAFPEVDSLNARVRYRNPMILYHNNGNGRFDDVSGAAGPGLLELHSSRGAAFGDIDNDGSIEIVVNNQNEAPSLLKQTLLKQTLLKQMTAGSNHWIILQLAGTKSNRSAIGARVRLTAAGRSRIDQVMSGGSYLSQSDLRLHFGLGASQEVDSIEITWPGGARQKLEHVRADRVVSIRE